MFRCLLFIDEAYDSYLLVFFFLLDFFIFFFFFFQAEDGIRDRDVTGVQTCALPIYKARSIKPSKTFIISGKRPQRSGPLKWFSATCPRPRIGAFPFIVTWRRSSNRSEERRVGKESRYGRGTEERRKREENGEVGSDR